MSRIRLGSEPCSAVHIARHHSTALADRLVGARRLGIASMALKAWYTGSGAPAVAPEGKLQLPQALAAAAA